MLIKDPAVADLGELVAALIRRRRERSAIRALSDVAGAGFEERRDAVEAALLAEMRRIGDRRVPRWTGVQAWAAGSVASRFVPEPDRLEAERAVARAWAGLTCRDGEVVGPGYLAAAMQPEAPRRRPHDASSQLELALEGAPS